MQQHTDRFTHVLARQQRGVTKASIAAVVTAGKIPLLLTDVEGVQRAQANHLDCLTVFMAPASLEVHTVQMPKQHCSCSCSCILFRHQFDTFTSSTQAAPKLSTEACSLGSYETHVNHERVNRPSIDTLGLCVQEKCLGTLHTGNVRQAAHKWSHLFRLVGLRQ